MSEEAQTLTRGESPGLKPAARRFSFPGASALPGIFPQDLCGGQRLAAGCWGARCVTGTAESALPAPQLASGRGHNCPIFPFLGRGV